MISQHLNFLYYLSIAHLHKKIKSNMTMTLIFPNYLDKCVGTGVRSETVAVPVKSSHVIETNDLTTGRASVFLAGPSASVARAARTQILVKTKSYIGPCVLINYS